MGNKLTNMEKVRELLKLKFEQGLSARDAALRIGIGKTAASEYVAGFISCGLTLKEAFSLSDTELVSVLNMKKQDSNGRYGLLASKFENFEGELKQVGVTLQLLWKEYLEKAPDGYGYSQFCHHFYQWEKTQKVSMHIQHKAGDKMFVDFTGVKHPITDPSNRRNRRI